jgi:hypothetical protein
LVAYPAELFADATCAIPLVYDGARGCAAPRYSVATSALVCGGVGVATVFSTGAELADKHALYTRSATGTCTPAGQVSTASALRYYERGPEMAPSAFVEFTAAP